MAALAPRPSDVSSIAGGAARGLRKKPFWMTRAMAEDFTRQDVLFTTFREVLLYIIFIALVTITTYGRRTTSQYYLTQALKKSFISKSFNTENEREIEFESIRTTTDFWKYCEEVLINSVYWETYYNPYDPPKPVGQVDSKILFENKLLGVPRIRQLRVKNGSCKVHKLFKNFFASCYAPFSEEHEEKASFGKRKGRAWRYSSPNKVLGERYSSKISTYSGGGYYQDLSTDKEETKEIIEDLKNNLWITRATRVIFIDFALYNANLNLFGICKLVFERPATGGVVSGFLFQAVYLIPFVTTWDKATFGCEMILYAIMFYYFCEELREIVYFKFRYLIQFWTYIDILIITLSITNMVTSIIIYNTIDDEILKIEKEPDKYGNLEYLGGLKDLYNSFNATLLFMTYIKCFKYLNFNKTMGQLNNTLKRCVVDMVGFAIMFFIIFFAFAELGFLLFGSQAKDFRSFGLALFTQLRTILGDFDFNAINEANKTMAPIYFLSYIFMVFFVLLNMFLAIINDTYADIKTEIPKEEDEMQMTEYLRKIMAKMSNKVGCGFILGKLKLFWLESLDDHTTDRQIREALAKCGFSSLEIEMFFARYNIDPLAEVNPYDVAEVMRDLEEKSNIIAKDRGEDEGALVKLSDFIEQRDRLAAMENSIQICSQLLDELFRQLDILEGQRRQAATRR